jgi:uncharacterized integral membrane protein (TIGR00698 family)
MLFALLIGIAFNYLAESSTAGEGIRFASRNLLRMAVALLGVRLTLADVSALGGGTVLLVLGGVLFTIVVGTLLGRRFGLPRNHALLSAGAVAICGASAALAIATVLPGGPRSERHTMVTVIGVTTLSTIAMTLYPALVGLVAFDDRTAGIFLGATIHDVAQVIGAGYIISDQAGETAAVVKLLRVACLMPVVFVIGLLMRRSTQTDAGAPPLLPWFVVGFVVLMTLNSAGAIPAPLVLLLGHASQWGLLIAVAALGVRTSLQELTAVGARPLYAIVAQTLLLAGFALTGLVLLQRLQ